MKDYEVFQKNVEDLLRLSGRSVSKEALVGHKKVDLLLTERRFGKVHRIVVECKCYSAQLTKKEVSVIYADYLPLIQKRLADQILLVTLEGLAPSAIAMVEESMEISHQTLSELQSEIIDFDSYLDLTAQKFHERGLSQYYINARVKGSNCLLEEEIVGWIRSRGGAAPKAILGSYGQGKTSFALYLTHKLATGFKRNPSSRIPIYIPLGQISAEQSLEGLLGKLFTAISPTPGYSFSRFEFLNRSGRFVVIFDGFDEMKHTLSWDEFRYNFSQINRLVCPESRVLLLGRPTAFLSDEEQQYALGGGVRVVRGQELRDADWPKFEELHLAPFSTVEIKNFLSLYLSYRRKTDLDGYGSKFKFDSAEEKIHELSGKALYEIASRPVQLRMLAEILPDFEGRIDSLTVVILYEVFIDKIIEREQEKIARRQFQAPERRHFAREIAWWLWAGGRKNAIGSRISLTAAEIPAEILANFMKTGLDRNAVVRDLVAACFLERKERDTLFFPHRSFQEFLVAEHVLVNLRSASMLLRVADEYCTPEVGSFICSMSDVKDIISIERQLLSYRGRLHLAMISLWFARSFSQQDLTERIRLTRNPWYLLFFCVGTNQGRFVRSPVVEAQIETLQSKTDDLDYCLFLHFCRLVLVKGASVSRSEAFWSISNSVLEILRLGLGGSWSKSRRVNRSSKFEYLSNLMMSREGRKLSIEPRVRSLIGRIRISRVNKTLDLRPTYRTLGVSLYDFCMVADWVDEKILRVPQPGLPEIVSLPHEGHDLTKFAKELISVVRQFADTFPASTDEI